METRTMAKQIADVWHTGDTRGGRGRLYSAHTEGFGLTAHIGKIDKVNLPSIFEVKAETMARHFAAFLFESDPPATFLNALAANLANRCHVCGGKGYTFHANYPEGHALALEWSSDCRACDKSGQTETEEADNVCNECGANIPSVGNGGVMNRHHAQTCSAFDASAS